MLRTGINKIDDAAQPARLSSEAMVFHVAPRDAVQAR